MQSGGGADASAALSQTQAEPCGVYRAALPVPGQAAGCVRETERTLDHVLSSTLNSILLI